LEEKTGSEKKRGRVQSRKRERKKTREEGYRRGKRRYSIRLDAEGENGSKTKLKYECLKDM